jgi:dTDP-4-dehydrorhamnose reductase
MTKVGKLLVTGSGGQLGTDLVEVLSDQNQVVGAGLPEVDIRNRDTVLELFTGERPEVVLHAAAYTDVDACETDEAVALAVNSEGTRNIALAAAEIGARLIYFSTDYVFDGSKPSPYVETDSPNPQTVYGRSKLAGEEAVRELVDDFAILRIGWVYGRYGKNFVKTMVRLGKRQLEGVDGSDVNAPLRVVDDQTGNPTWTIDIARQTGLVIREGLRGVFHATSEGEATWLRFAQNIFEILDMPVVVQPCSSAEFGRPALRPARSSLDNAQLRAEKHNIMREYDEALKEFLDLHGRELLL